MKFSYNWIREFVEGLDTPAAGLERLITMKTAECEGIEAVAAEYGAQEVIVVTITHDHEARRRSYELLADAFELTTSPLSRTSST